MYPVNFYRESNLIYAICYNVLVVVVLRCTIMACETRDASVVRLGCLPLALGRGLQITRMVVETRPYARIV
jgi:hypothetical protein